MKEIKQLIADFDRWTGKGNLIQANQTASRLFAAFADKLGFSEAKAEPEPEPEPETTKQLLTEPAPVAKTVLVEPAPVVATVTAHETSVVKGTDKPASAKKATAKPKGE
jgi:hypothetical protein